MKESIWLFFALQTQWRWVSVGFGGAIRTGLDYTAIPKTAELAGVTMTTRVFDDIRTLERAAIEAWSSKHGRF